ncbi:helix-turn-helix domain-containing protein [Longitalea arenae]|uniref:helix-turn-helix domain-containing protein n=1 Tax=Longitalea arenae TaxID=2812558 RepID=UPI001967BEFB|nr:helix-turn-helix domain-containing protein [Longitalea arenae]
MSEVNDKAPFLLIQKPQELIKLFEGLIDRKIREIGVLAAPPSASANGESPFLSTKEVQKIFGVSRQTINDWRKSRLLPSIKIKSRRYFIRDQVQALQQKWKSPGDQ